MNNAWQLWDIVTSPQIHPSHPFPFYFHSHHPNADNHPLSPKTLQVFSNWTSCDDLPRGHQSPAIPCRLVPTPPSQCSGKTQIFKIKPQRPFPKADKTFQPSCPPLTCSSLREGPELAALRGSCYSISCSGCCVGYFHLTSPRGQHPRMGSAF